MEKAGFLPAFFFETIDWCYILSLFADLQAIQKIH